MGHETAVVGASRSSSNSSTDALHSLEAADRLQREMEKPGALRDVSKAPLSILIGLIFQFPAIGLCQPSINKEKKEDGSIHS